MEEPAASGMPHLRRLRLYQELKFGENRDWRRWQPSVLRFSLMCGTHMVLLHIRSKEAPLQSLVHVALLPELQCTACLNRHTKQVPRNRKSI